MKPSSGIKDLLYFLYDYAAEWVIMKESNTHGKLDMSSALLEELIEPVSQCFTPEVAQRIAALRASPAVQSRMDELADKCNEGTLSDEEKKLYSDYVRTVNFIGVLQAKARKIIQHDGR